MYSFVFAAVAAVVAVVVVVAVVAVALFQSNILNGSDSGPKLQMTVVHGK